MNVSVIIPTFRRPDDLLRCLEALRQQSKPPAEIVVAVRDIDTKTLDRLATYAKGDLPLEIALVAEASTVASMSAALARTTGDIVAITDDDAAPRPDWIERIVAHFTADPKLGGVGGRDWQPIERWDELKVGRLQWFGRIVGNHHLGTGGARPVEVIKGVNCAFRGNALREIGFDRRMRGAGTVIHWELSLSFSFLRRGWTLIYDPEVAVDHYISKRTDADVNHRGGFHGPSLADAVHNETLSLLEHFGPAQKLAFFLWAGLVGTWEVPGVAQVVRTSLMGRKHVLARFRWAMWGRLEGWKSYRQNDSNPSRPEQSMPVRMPA
jgi:cellulose synthase/poly-beta-1,6-N-acetylglucosamine synthase-like glycosyltransferase